MHIYNAILQHILKSIEALQVRALLPSELKTDAITAEPPRDPSHGDVATNAAMVLAKQAKMKPRDIAELIAQELKHWSELEDVDIAGPGFINLRLASDYWRQVIPVILESKQQYGDSYIGKGIKVNVEYVSANPTGPLHIGHARGAIYGDALAALLSKAGYDVTREYYVNDAGAQIDTLARSAYLRYREACGEEIEIPEGLYPGEYLKPVGELLKQQHGNALLDSEEIDWLPVVRQTSIDAMMKLIRENLAELGIFHEVFTSEQSLHDSGAIEQAIDVLKEKGLVEYGVLEPPKGKKPDDWEEREQLLFRSTGFGDDTDRALQKSDGSYTYFAADLALSQHKIARGYDELIYMFGADHGGYKKRMEASIAALSDGKVGCDIKLCQLVHLLKDGQPVKMSKRAGNFETVSDVVGQVGKDVLRFMMLTRKNDMVMEFDLDEVTKQTKDNPVFYVQYAHARAQSVLRQAKELMPQAWQASQSPGKADLALLTHAQELKLIKEMALFPRTVEAAAKAHEPHRTAYYLQELAATFHGLWHVGAKEGDLRLIVEDKPQLTTARLALARAVAGVVACGLTLLGVQPLDEL